MTKAVLTWFIAMLVSAPAQIRFGQTPPERPAEKPDRTFEFLFNMGPVQRAHSRLHGFLYTFEHPLQTLQSWVIESSVANSEVTPILPPPAVLINEMACRVDSVFVGSVLGGATYPIADGTFLFTDYSVRVIEVLKSPAQAQLSPGSGTTVSRLGGSITIDKTVVKTEALWLPMPAKDTTYLFLVRFIPETSDFISGPVSTTANMARLEGSKWFFLDEATSSAGDLREIGVDRSLVTPGLVQDCRSARDLREQR